MIAPIASLEVSLAERSYPIVIGDNLLERAELLLPHLGRKQVAVVTNTTVAPLYLDRFAQALRAAGVDVLPIVLPEGEAHKNWQTLKQVFDALLEARCERSTTLVALGGGVVGTSADSPPRSISAAFPSSRFRPPCSRRWIRPSAARPPSTIRSART
jgi:3-dehydroquinate synthase